MCRKIYPEALNVLYQVRSNGYWYCLCDRFDGCSFGRTSKTINCPICKIGCDFDIDSSEEVKYKPEKLFFYVSKLVDEMKIAISIDKAINFRCQEYYFK